MQVHEGAPDLLFVRVAVGVLALAAREAVLAGVDESAREGRAEVDVVRAAGPLETVAGRTAAHRPVAAAVVQFAGRTGARQRVRHPRCRDGVHERRFSSPCTPRHKI